MKSCWAAVSKPRKPAALDFDIGVLSLPSQECVSFCVSKTKQNKKLPLFSSSVKVPRMLKLELPHSSSEDDPYIWTPVSCYRVRKVFTQKKTMPVLPCSP